MEGVDDYDGFFEGGKGLAGLRSWGAGRGRVTFGSRTKLGNFFLDFASGFPPGFYDVRDPRRWAEGFIGEEQGGGFGELGIHSLAHLL